jgi:hypothetical protein
MSVGKMQLVLAPWFCGFLFGTKFRKIFLCVVGDEKGSCYASQTGPKLMILLPQSSECWV